MDNIDDNEDVKKLALEIRLQKMRNELDQLK